MRTKEFERESVLSNMFITIILAAVIFVGYIMFTANPGEVVKQTLEERAQQKEAAAWNAEISTLINSGDMDAAMSMALNGVYELTEENAATIQKWKELQAREERFVKDMLGEIRTAYLAGEKELAADNLRTLGQTYPDNNYVKAYMELFSSVEKTLVEEDMYDWKYGGTPGYGTYKDYRGNAVTGFCFTSNYISNGEYGYFDTMSYTQVTIEASCIALGSETLPITITDLNSGKEYTVHCPKGSVSETWEISGGNIQISTPDDSIYAYGSAVVSITLNKELTEADFAAVDVRF